MTESLNKIVRQNPRLVHKLDERKEILSGPLDENVRRYFINAIHNSMMMEHHRHMNIADNLYV